jgi:hypothetical protein
MNDAWIAGYDIEKVGDCSRESERDWQWGTRWLIEYWATLKQTDSFGHLA